MPAEAADAGRVLLGNASAEILDEGGVVCDVEIMPRSLLAERRLSSVFLIRGMIRPTNRR